tara:strand:+ start:45 stop:497 length:453 start_codon:yes stop_codon:yes gene_type:complete
MAFALFDKNNGLPQLIASTQAEIDQFSNNGQFTQKDISDSDYNAVRQNLKTIKLDVAADNVVVTDEDQTPPAPWLPANAAELDGWWGMVEHDYDTWSTSNGDKEIAGRIKTYIDYCKGVDKGSLTYPINWEKHCADNGVEYFHNLQIKTS